MLFSEVVQMIKIIKVVSLWAEDVSETVQFYRDVLGLELLSHHPNSQPHFRVGDAYLIILNGKPRPAENPEPTRFPLLAFEVDNLDTAVERLSDQQVELPWGIEGSGTSRYVMLYDPAGNLIELT